MWLLAYWWQALILVLLYGFLFSIYKKLSQEHLKEPAALFWVINGSLGSSEYKWPEDQIMLLYKNEQLKINGEKLYVYEENIFWEKNGETKKILPGDIFDFAGGSLKLVRWNNARQFINQYRTSTKSQ